MSNFSLGALMPAQQRSPCVIRNSLDPGRSGSSVALRGTKEGLLRAQVESIGGRALQLLL